MGLGIGRAARRRALLTVAAVVATVGLVSASPAGAIVYGELDGDGHPNVGALLADLDPDHAGPEPLCTGTLIDDQVFLTASHCTAYLESLDIDPHDVWVTFDPKIGDGMDMVRGTYVTHERYGDLGMSNSFDIAVILLDDDPGVAPARLPTAGLLDQMKRAGQLPGTRFTAVGYGLARDTRRTGPQALTYTGDRRVSSGTYLSLRQSWLTISMNQATGNGGTCNGDSGGPHFLGTSDVVVSLTVVGDFYCKATDVTYRLDSASAREFLARFVALPA